MDHWSPALGVLRSFFIFVPAEARHDGRLRLPVIYLLRGHEREWINKHEDSSRAGTQNVIDIYEQLRAAGEIGPLILAFPGVTDAAGKLHGMAVNMLAPHLAQEPTIGSGRFEDYLVRDLIPFVDRHYPTLGDGHRGVDGFSLGGLMSVKLALQYPGLFSTVGAYDGLFLWNNPSVPGAVDAEDPVLANPLFKPVFGHPLDQRHLARNSPLALIERSNGQAARLRWLIEYGPESAEPNDSNCYRGRRMEELLLAQGARNALRGEVEDGSHTWRIADEHMRRSLPIHWRTLHKR